MDRICILGGGFGGLYTALELTRQPWSDPPQITLVDREERFVFLPLLYELLTEEMEDWEVAPRFVDLLAEANLLRFVRGEVHDIDIEQRRVWLGDGMDPLDYDCLVLALGGDTPLDSVPGAAAHAIPFRRLADAQRLKQAARSWQSKEGPISLAIAGAGASGVELACKLSDRLGPQGRIRLVDMGSQILPGFGTASREAAAQALAQRGVALELETRVLQVQPTALQVERQGQVQQDPVDGVIWTVGTKVAAAIARLPLAKNERGRLQVLPTLQVPGHPEILALGDAAAAIDAEGQAVPATAQAAFQQASFAAWNVRAQVLGQQPLLPFRYQPLGEMLSLGMDTAVLSSLGLTLTGALGYLARRAVYLARMPTLGHQMRVGWNWMARPLALELRRWLRSA